jgi:hypothetical protein
MEMKVHYDEESEKPKIEMIYTHRVPSSIDKKVKKFSVEGKPSESSITQFRGSIHSLLKLSPYNTTTITP